MSGKLLSSLVQTKSIELVLAPIAAQVSRLIVGLQYDLTVLDYETTIAYNQLNCSKKISPISLWQANLVCFSEVRVLEVPMISKICLWLLRRGRELPEDVGCPLLSLSLRDEYLLEKKCLGKSNDTYSLSIRVQTTINHIFYHTVSMSKKMFFFQSAM